MVILSDQSLPQTTTIRPTFNKGGKGTAKTKGIIWIELEWKLQLKSDKFCRDYLKKCLVEAMVDIGDNIKERAKMQASGATIYKPGMTKWERIRAYYNAPKLSSPERVRIETGRYINSFWALPESDPNKVKVKLTVGNNMRYGKWVEARTGNIAAAMLSLWMPILYRISTSIGKAFQNWELQKEISTSTAPIYEESSGWIG